jgi:DNA-directed RNA polymerase specialized sigma24 family protein
MNTEQLLAKMGPVISQVAHKYSRCPSTQDEIEQEAKIACWRVVEKYSTYSDPEIVRVSSRAIHNAAISVLRQQQRHKRSFDDAPPVIVKPTEGSFVQGEWLDSLQSQLAPRDVVVLSELRRGLTAADCARLHGLTEVGVHRSVVRIRELALGMDAD